MMFPFNNSAPPKDTPKTEPVPHAQRTDLATMSDHKFMHEVQRLKEFPLNYGGFCLIGKYIVQEIQRLYHLDNTLTPNPAGSIEKIYDFKHREVFTAYNGLTTKEKFSDLDNPEVLDEAYDAHLKLGGLEIDWKRNVPKKNVHRFPGGLKFSDNEK